MESKRKNRTVLVTVLGSTALAVILIGGIFLVGRKHTEPIKEGILSKGFPEKHLEVFDKVEDAISRAYAVKTDQHKYILLENDLPDNY